MPTAIVQVDAFTDRAFAGNPAAVCVLPGPRDERWMQDIAREMNLSETAFLHPENDGYRLRWFTPAVEVPLCGHATLASAHVLWQDRHLPENHQARFYTRSGLLQATRLAEEIQLDFPAQPASPCPVPAHLAEALGTVPIDVLRNEHKLLAVLDSEASLRRLKPDIGLVRKIPAQGIIVTSRATTAGYDFVSRFFAPNAGVDEDPVTGSAHCCLAPYWCRQLGRHELVGYQASARGGTVRVRLEGDRVFLSGRAVTVLRAELLV
jgi:PhzF family phenazine biosynthesis protein